MKTLIRAVVVALAVSPIVAMAQSDEQPVTRAEVRGDLIQLEKAGYEPAERDAQYPSKLQAAESKVQSENMAAKPGMTSYGPSAEGTSNSGPAASGN